MKKTLALLMTLALLVSAAAIPAMAEETDSTVDQVTSATTQAGKGGHSNRQQASGQDSQASTDSRKQNSRSVQAPAENQLGRKPGRNGRGNQAQGQNSQVPQAPVDEQASQQPGQNDQSVPADGNTQGVQNTRQSRGSRGSRNSKQSSESAAQSGAAESTFDVGQLLKSLLDNNCITQEQYDLLLKMITPADASVT